MKALPTTLPELVLLELRAFGDNRGFFKETYQRERYLAHGIGVGLEFVQDNLSSSKRGTLRGLHYSLRAKQGKLVHVTRGEVFDVAVDIRRGSPRFGQWFGVHLSGENHRQLWIPPGFAHGYVVLSEQADFAYKVTSYYDASDERAIRWDDPELGIEWPLDGQPELSSRDQTAAPLSAAELPAYEP